MDAEKALKVLDEVIRRTTVQMPTPLGQRGESTMHPVHFCDYLHEIRQAREYFARALSPPASAAVVPDNYAELLDAVRKINGLHCLGDAIYDVREREGEGWEGKNVLAYSAACEIITKHLAATPSPPVGEKGEG